jgi:hypothetical protein
MKTPSYAISLSLFLSLGTIGCIEQSSTIVTFDTELQSTTFTNKLLAPLAIYRDGVVIDTLPAKSTRTYPLGRSGIVRHAWKLVTPLDRLGKKTGVEPYVDLGVQYLIVGDYTIDNESVPSKTLFTPMVANFSPWKLRLIANYEEDDQVYTDYLIPSDINLSLTRAPYFYWNASSNVRLESTTNRSDYYFISRLDTNNTTNLRLDTQSNYTGSGRTIPRTVY